MFQVYNANNAVVAGPLTNAPVGVTNGLFTVMLDFGAGVFNGGAISLEIGVRTNGATSAYIVLSPRQTLTSVPYAIQSLNASNAAALTTPLPATNLVGTIPNSLLSPSVAILTNNMVFSGSVTATNFTGNGAKLTGVNAATAGTATAAQTATNWLGSYNRIFFVATNGNNATAVMGDSSHPFAPVFSTTSGVCSLATNAGDCICLLPGSYIWPSTAGIPVWGDTTFRGASRSSVIIVCTNPLPFNGLNSATSTFAPQGDNAHIRSLTWLVQPASAYGSFLFGQQSAPTSWKGVTVEDCDLLAGVDVFYWSYQDPSGFRGAIVENCYIHSTWDFAAFNNAGGGYLTSINNTYFASEENGPAEFRVYGICFSDYGSRFYGFHTWQTPTTIIAAFGNSGAGGKISVALHGSQFYVTNAAWPLFNGDSSSAVAGDYMDMLNFREYSLSPDRGFTYNNYTNYAYTYTYGSSNLFYIYGGTKQGVTNNTYLAVGALSTNWCSAELEWTNVKDSRFVLAMNSPAGIRLLGAAPPIPLTLESNGVILWDATVSGNGCGNPFVDNISSFQFSDTQSGAGTVPHITLGTNSIRTNLTIYSAPELSASIRFPVVSIGPVGVTNGASAMWNSNGFTYLRHFQIGAVTNSDILISSPERLPPASMD